MGNKIGVGMRLQIDQTALICNFLSQRADIGYLQEVIVMEYIVYSGLFHEETYEITIVVIEFDFIILYDYLPLLVHTGIGRFLYNLWSYVEYFLVFELCYCSLGVTVWLEISEFC